MIDPKVKEYSEKLNELGIEHEILEHPELKEVLEVMNYLKLPLTEAASTLIVKIDEKFAALVRRDDCNINYEKVKKILGAETVRMATEEEFAKLTDVPVGAARVYHPGLITLLDRKLFEQEYVIGGSGSFICSLRYKSEDLKKIPGSRVADFAEINREKIKTKRVFSGSRPTGKLHLGNYLGGVKGYLALSERPDFDCIYSVVDLHGITTPYDPKTYQPQVFDVVLDYLACGLNPKKCHLMIQSQVPEHVELAYLLGTIYPVSRVEQLPTYKDKKAENPDYINVGLFYYPILMAADILVYKAELVPVGIDQEPHIELTREVARKFNTMFPSTSSGQVLFPEPQRFATPGEYVPSLLGSGKMSKSVAGSYILLTDDLETIKKRLAQAPTDIGKGERVPKEGGVANLLTLVELFKGKEARQKYEKQYLDPGIKYSELKEELAQEIYKELDPIQERRKYFEGHASEVTEILEEGRAYCSSIAKQTLAEVKKMMGLVY